MPLTEDHSFVLTDSMESEHLTSLSEETAVSIDPDSRDISLSYIIVTVEDRGTLSKKTEKLQDLLPAVTAHLSEHSRLEEWVSCLFVCLFVCFSNL